MTKEEKKDYNRAWYLAHPGYAQSWREKNKDRDAKNRITWRKANPDKHKATYTRWRNRHLLQEKQRFAEFYSENREKIAARKKAQRLSLTLAQRKEIDRRNYDRDKLSPAFVARNRANVKRHRKAHPEFKRHHEHVRRARKRGTGVGNSAPVLKFIKSVRSKRLVKCYYCSTRVPGPKAHIDHVIPLAKGGAHELGNLCCSCPKCNSSKGAKLPSEFMAVLSL